MKKNRIIIVVFVVLCLGIFDFFHVSGKEIRHLKDLGKECSVTVTVFEKAPTTGIGTGGYRETECYTLTAEQTEELKQLLLSSTFRRNLSDTLVWQSDEQEKRYDIFVDFGDGQRVISIHAAGNHYISITDQFAGHFLMIRNDGWEETLTRILGKMK